jgi:hypothetical protein
MSENEASFDNEKYIGEQTAAILERVIEMKNLVAFDVVYIDISCYAR